MVRLDAGLGLENVGVDGALAEEADSLELGRLLVEDLDELLTDDVTLGLGVGHACQLVEEAVGGVHVDELGAQLVAEHIDDLLGLALAHEAVVHVHAYELLADSLDEQRGNHRGVDAARKRQQDLAIAHLGAHGLYGLGDEGISELGRVDTRHVIGTMIAGKVHGLSFEWSNFGRKRV